jgi:hypothetical protein
MPPIRKLPSDAFEMGLESGDAAGSGSRLRLRRLSRHPAWSSFSSFLPPVLNICQGQCSHGGGTALFETRSRTAQLAFFRDETPQFQSVKAAQSFSLSERKWIGQTTR